MAIQSVANGMGFWLESGNPAVNLSVAGNVMDAAGESVSFIGKVYIEGAASSKTISAAGGGKIFFRTGTCTFVNAGTNFRIGVQDLASTGLEDGTFDVYADFTGGGGGIASNQLYEKAMTSGTKTISHGDIVAISFEMTTKGGSDSIQTLSFNGTNLVGVPMNFPYKTTDTGSGPVRSSANTAGANIIFDDGTLGWLEMAFIHPYTSSSIAYNQTSTPDEYAAVFQVPYKCRIRGAYLSIGSIASTDNFDIIVYSDAQGTPVAEITVSVDPNYTGSTSNSNTPYYVAFSSVTLEPNTWYALACRPTTNNNINIYYNDMTATFGSKYKIPLPFGANCKFSGRANQTGVFTEVQTYFMPLFGLLIDGLDDGAGGGGLSPFTTVFLH